MRTLRRIASLSCLLLASAGLAGADDRPWIEVRSPRFTVLSQANEKATREMAWQFEQVHSVFTRAYPWAKLESGRPFIVLAMRDEKALRELSPRFWDGWKMRPGAAFVRAAGQDFVALRTDVTGSDEIGENPYLLAYEGYVSIVLNASFPGTLPLWFKRGLQTFYGNTLVREKDVHIGRLVKRYLALLNEGGRYTIPQLMAIEADSPSFRKEADREVFEAQAWLFVHYLVFGENGSLLLKLNRFAGQLRNGRPGADAFAEAFGDTEPLEKGLASYLSRRLYQYARLDIDVNVDRASFPVRPVPPAEAKAWRASYMSAMDEPAPLTRALAESALAADRAEPVAHEVLGVLADKESRVEDAREAFARAVENGSLSYHAHYRLAQLLWKPDNDPATLARIAAVLEKAVQLNPDHAWSHRYLADTRVSLGNASTALEPARKAVVLAPGESNHRRTLARTLGALGQLDAAQREAAIAQGVARTEEDKRHGRELLAWVIAERAAAAARAAATSATSAPAAPPATPPAAASSAQKTPPAEGGRTVAAEHPCEVNDPQQCRRWLVAADKACAEGTLEACNSAGWAYSAGPPGAERDPAKATRMLEKACAGGIQLACVNLAVNLAAGRNPEDLKRALDLLSNACAAGSAEACRLKASLQATRR